ncbi:MAG: ABC transporter ATP-binding protein [Erysipelotrichaceae bacterium]|nr:ABC transporter ATP-binding protein [Erysipelotrichaceae bacterium]
MIGEYKVDNRNDALNDSAFRSIATLINRWKDGTFKEIIDDWKWIFSYSRKYKGAIVFYTVLGIISSSLSLVSSLVSMYLIDIITGHKTDKLVSLIVVMISSSLLSLLFSSLISRISTRLTIDIYNDIRSDIFDHIMDADWLSISNYSQGDILNRFNNDANTVCSNAISWLPTVIVSIYNFIIVFFAVWRYSKIMALISFVAAPFMFLMSKFLVRKQREYGMKAKQMASRVMSFEVETFANFDTIKSFGISNKYGEKMKDWQNKKKDLSLEYNLFSIKTRAFLSIMGMCVQMIGFLYCLWLLWNNSITYGTMVFFLQQRNRLSTAFNKIIGIIPAFLGVSISANRIRELVDLPKEVHVKDSSEIEKYKDTGFTVEMDGIDFSYVEDQKVIISSSFFANPGEIVAIVGPSGEGKTTMIRLILGLIRPQEGQVRIKARNGEFVEANVDSRYLFAYVPQGNTILSGTIAENMRLIKEDATDEEIIEALKIACAWQFVEKMPLSINSQVRERGGGLSEGQAQRLSIARAILKDAPVLLLDEATSALDIQTERDVLRNIVQQRPNKTCIVTTHRPSVLDISDRVYRVMKREIRELNEEESSRMSMDF